MVKIGVFFLALAAVPTEAFKFPFFGGRVEGEDYPAVVRKPVTDPNLFKPPGFEHLSDKEIR